MNCHDAEEFVSLLHDGESVPADFMTHFRACPVCQERLESYTRIGSELRQMASNASETKLPAFPIERLQIRPKWQVFAFLKSGVLLPRFAVLVLIGSLIAASISLVVVRAQAPVHPLWFQFELDPTASHDGHELQHVVQAGYDDGMEIWLSDPPSIVGIHVRVLAVSENNVQVALRARRMSTSDPAKHRVKEVLQNSSVYTFVPGQTLQVPIEGGGTLELRGKVIDHQPKIAFGEPLEPDAGELRLSSPILITGTKVLYDLQGASAFTDDKAPNDSIVMYAPEAGLLTFALRQFPGAVQGQANWGMLTFQINGQKYSLRSASPITGGDQPQEVWVKRDADYHPGEDHHPNQSFIGCRPLNESQLTQSRKPSSHSPLDQPKTLLKKRT